MIHETKKSNFFVPMRKGDSPDYFECANQEERKKELFS